MKALLLVSQDKARVSYLHAGLAQGDVGGDWHLQVPHTWVSCAPLASYQMNKINKINKIKKKCTSCKNKVVLGYSCTD